MSWMVNAADVTKQTDSNETTKQQMVEVIITAVLKWLTPRDNETNEKTQPGQAQLPQDRSGLPTWVDEKLLKGPVACSFFQL